jgi:HAD superfamily hydrolase (TIGR01509 family)
MLRWIFFDVGNVLLDEDPLTYRNVCRHVDAIRSVRPDRSFLDLLAERGAYAAAGSRWPLFDLASRYLDEARVAAVWDEAAREIRAEFAALSPPVEGAAEALERLDGRYRLGLIANQGAECRARLAALGWLDRFEVVAFGEEWGVFKPDPALFQTALDEAGIAPERALMVGDRIDNDIRPAAALGMATAWIRWPRRAAKGWPPVGRPDPEARAYLASLEGNAAGLLAHEPTVTIDRIAELPEALGSLSSRGINSGREEHRISNLP